MTDRSKTGFERFCSIPAFWMSLLVSRVRRGVPVWTRPYSIRDPCRNRRSRACCLLLTGDSLPATSNLRKSTVALAATGRIVEIVQNTGASLSLCWLHDTDTGVPRVSKQQSAGISEPLRSSSARAVPATKPPIAQTSAIAHVASRLWFIVSSPRIVLTLLPFLRRCPDPSQPASYPRPDQALSYDSPSPHRSRPPVRSSTARPG